MARTCGVCNGPFRHDESHHVVTLSAEAAPRGGGNYICCPRCKAHHAGQDAPAPKRYLAGDMTAAGLPFPICSLCRLALPENEGHGTHCRIHAPPEGVQAGVYVMCRACMEKHRGCELEVLR